MSAVARLATPFLADERTALSEFLDVQRETLLRKTAGLDAASLRATVPPSTMTLGGLVTHLALVEHSWFQVTFLGRERGEPWASLSAGRRRGWEWDTAAADDPDRLRALLEAEIAAARDIATAHEPDAVSLGTTWTGERCTLRWIVMHMVQEYARHNGHADLLREAIDGSVGL